VGDHRQAREGYRRAADRFRELSLLPHLGLCLLEANRFAGEDDGEAIAILSRLGADGLRGLTRLTRPALSG
jgi:hypothetical protein